MVDVLGWGRLAALGLLAVNVLIARIVLQGVPGSPPGPGRLRRHRGAERVRLAILANPAASGFSGDALRRVTGILRNRYEVDQLWPSAAGGIEATVRSAIDSGADVVAAMGGDGVAHHAAAALVGPARWLSSRSGQPTSWRILGIPADPVQPPKRWSRTRPIDLALARLQGSGATGTVDTIATFSAGMGSTPTSSGRPRRAVPQVPDGWSALSRTPLRTALGSYVGRHRSGWTTATGADNGVAVLVQVHEPYTYLGPFPLRLAPRSPASLAVLILEEVVAGRIRRSWPASCRGDGSVPCRG